MQEQPSISTIVEMIQSAEELVAELRSRSPARSEIRTQLDHVRSGIMRLAEATMLLHPVGMPSPHPTGRQVAMPAPEPLRDGLLRAWGYTSFLQHQVDMGVPNRFRLADYAEGLLDELVDVQEQLTTDRW